MDLVIEMRASTKLALVAAGVAGAALLRRQLSRARYSFKDKVVVIAGASRGLGLAMARQLADEGARLALLARNQDDLRNAEDHVASHHAQVISIPCDIRNQPEVEAAIALVIERFGRVDILINNAGIIQIGPIDNMAMGDFDDAMATHVYGPLFTMLEVIPHMRRQGGGRIVNIASIGGKIAVPHLIPYCTSKFALVGLSDGMRVELARDGIKVTTVCPWLMRTGSVYNIQVKGEHEREFAWFARSASIPLLTINVERAAHKVIEACRRGSPRLVMSIWGKAAMLVNELTPGAMSAIERLANRLLPKPQITHGDFPRTGWQSRSLAPKPLQRIAQSAAIRNNEIRHAIRESRRPRITPDGAQRLAEAVEHQTPSE